MLVLKDALSQGISVVVRIGGYNGLDDDGTVIHLFIHKMDRTSGQLDPEIRLFGLGIDPGKAGKDSRMDIYNFSWKGRGEGRCQDTHKPGQDHSFCSGRLYCSHKGGVKCLSGRILGVIHNLHGNIMCLGTFQPVGLGIAGDNHGNAGIQTPGINGSDNRFEIGTASGNQHGYG